MRSTQRVEGMNAYFNIFLNQKVRLYEFVAQYDRALAKMRVNEAETESKIENSFPVLTTPLRSLEKHAAELFTRKIFSLFQHEIRKEGKLFVMERVQLEDHRTYRFGEYKAPTCTWTVEYFPANITMKCCCLKFESFGIPCCHMIAVMKSEQLMCIPPSCVLQRWTRRGRSKCQQPSLTQICSTLTQTARFGILSSCFSEMSYYASHADKDFEEAREIAFQLTSQMKKRWAMRKEGNAEAGDKNIAPKLYGVGDPNVVKTKGNPGGTSSMGKPPKPRRCGYCRSIGHTKRMCKKLASSSQREGSNSDSEPFMNTELDPHTDDIDELPIYPNDPV
ncbi:protein FAR1-RELATED SEQUENCE 5-like [Camellia sinensis]|uniref:protein FAR1-RELATED SEQUENCE 5-like n=1 Tax=Camellia sinensis TaxID=4442 RepID=UPI00103632B2|nr:protein FAR1-RELATED SEQUENCE 5-like [Camellia sinensis]